MNQHKIFAPQSTVVALDRELLAKLHEAREDPMIPVDGYTFGIATMTENAPHNGEKHEDGDEVLYLISGSVRIRLEYDVPEQLELVPGQGMIVPKGIWHRVDILKPSQIVYLTPGPNNFYKPLS